MSKAPPIPPEQQGGSRAPADISGRHATRDGAAAHEGENPTNQGQSANTLKNAPRWGKTQDR